MKKTVVAICYDFDKTLTTDNMQFYSFIPNLNIDEATFWGKCTDLVKKTGIDITLGYLRTMIDECKKQGIKLTREYLHSMGKDIKFCAGVKTWFSRLNKYAEKHNVQLEHYLISSGNKEMIEGTDIFKEFTNVFACEYLYDETGEAYWPKNIVNYTVKTQCLFRICKGAQDLTDEKTINKRIAQKHVEFRNMIYIGDGLTDIPCMTLVKERGGTAISVYNDNKNTCAELLEDNRVNFVCKSNYTTNSPLEKLIKMVIDSLALKENLLKKENETIKKIKKSTKKIIKNN